MIIKFNDGTELQVQSVEAVDNTLQVKTISAALPELREKFSDKFACKRMEVIEREQIVAVHENYTELNRLEDYSTGIFGAVLNKKGETVEDRIANLENNMGAFGKTLQDVVAKLFGAKE